MDLLTILVATLLGACALIFVLYPIYERVRQRGEQDDHGKQDESHEEQSNHTQGGGKPRPYYTRNTESDRNMVGAGASPTLDGTLILEHGQEEREQAARIALQEIELDFQLGNLVETDYRSLRERYMRRALLAMKSRHDHEQELDEAIEEQLRHLRETDEQAKE